ncbi:cyanophycinase [Marivirga arenosa]|uniref:Cyanophycinase n=1 Tax=Marivirga arenosa TaxID=3059076 RepID=A0AA51ZX63_9BACT|nr:cyanophycinase [Marivirga sp. BKB1-2]WNB18341.1 cyanophycinase [Marivirga sp. BKB1-2]
MKASAFLFLSSLLLACNFEESQNEVVDKESVEENTNITYYLTGSTSDIETNSSLGLLLAGGATDQKIWFDWMVSKSDGGDFVVLRTDDRDGYNDDTFIEGANSILTIVVDSKEKANSNFVREKIRAAEALFIAGGDQTEYYNLWKNTEVESAIGYLFNDKKVPIGGTSAGLAVLGGIAYIPQNLGVKSSEALENPYHTNMETLKTDFISIPSLQNIITDSHFSERNRLGRTISFMARCIQDGIIANYEVIKAIAVDEHTAVAIEENGDAAVFGNSEYQDYAYFLTANSSPNRCEANTPLHWTDGITAYSVRGKDNYTKSFNIFNWQPLTNEVTSEQVNVNNGIISNDIQHPE